MKRFLGTGAIVALSLTGAMLTLTTPALSQSAGEEGKVLAVDLALFQAWQAGDRVRMSALVSDDAKAFDGTIPMGALPTKAAYINAALADKPAPTAVLSKSAKTGNDAFDDGQTVRLFGSDSSVAAVTGLIVDKAKTEDKGEVYSAIYRKEGGNWKLYRHTISAKTKWYNVVGQSAIPANASGDTSKLTAEQKKVSDRLVLMMDAFGRRILKNLDGMLGDNLLYVHGEVGGHAEKSKKEYIDKKYADPSAYPEVIAILNPEVEILGANRDVAVLGAIRTDATGGGAYGIGYKPAWRSVSDQQSVWVRSGPDKDDWRLVHLHTSPYIAPPASR